MYENRDFLLTNTVSLAGGTEYYFICAKIVMYVFKQCYCGIGMLSTEGPSSSVIYPYDYICKLEGHSVESMPTPQ